MIVEMAGDERDIDIAGLTNGLAVVQRFQHGEQARVLLDVAGNGVEVASAYMARRLPPCLESGTCCGYGGIDIRAVGGGDLRKGLAVGWIDALKILTAGRPDPLIVDEEAERLVLLNPGQRGRGRFGGRAVLPCLE